MIHKSASEKQIFLVAKTSNISFELRPSFFSWTSRLAFKGRQTTSSCLPIRGKIYLFLRYSREMAKKYDSDCKPARATHSRFRIIYIKWRKRARRGFAGAVTRSHARFVKTFVLVLRIVKCRRYFIQIKYRPARANLSRLFDSLCSLVPRNLCLLICRHARIYKQH